eukprot:365950-Chlamydomonas_euryale.AAC.11
MRAAPGRPLSDAPRPTACAAGSLSRGLGPATRPRRLRAVRQRRATAPAAMRIGRPSAAAQCARSGGGGGSIRARCARQPMRHAQRNTATQLRLFRWRVRPWQVPHHRADADAAPAAGCNSHCCRGLARSRTHRARHATTAAAAAGARCRDDARRRGEAVADARQHRRRRGGAALGGGHGAVAGWAIRWGGVCRAGGSRHRRGNARHRPGMILAASAAAVAPVAAADSSAFRAAAFAAVAAASAADVKLRVLQLRQAGGNARQAIANKVFHRAVAFTQPVPAFGPGAAVAAIAAGVRACNVEIRVTANGPAGHARVAICSGSSRQLLWLKQLPLKQGAEVCRRGVESGALAALQHAPRAV